MHQVMRPSTGLLTFVLAALLGSVALTRGGLPAQPAATAGKMLKVESRTLSIELDPADGSFRQVRNKLTGLALFRRTGHGPPCALILHDGSIVTPSGRSQFRVIHGPAGLSSLQFQFSNADARVIVDVRASPTSSVITFSPTLVLGPGAKVDALIFPILSGMTTLGDPATLDYLAHPSASGLLVRDPLNTLRPDKVDHYYERFVHSEYPDGYYGCPMQFLAFYDDRQGGFYFGCHDPTSTPKELDFFRPPGKGYLEMKFVHYASRQVPPPKVEQRLFGYPVVFSATREGDWFEAADIYRSWVCSKGPGAPVWCRNGPKRAQSPKQCARWLQEKIGLATFGISCRHDESAWLTALQRAVGVRMLHVLGFDWETNDNSASDAAWEDLEKRWVNPANLRAIRSASSAFAVFKVDQWLSKSARDYAKLKGGSTEHEFIDGHRKKVWMCPAAADWANFYILRDRTLASAPDFACDALYNDTSVCCAAPLSCKNPAHGHPDGRKGAYMIRNYRELLRLSHEACAADKGGRHVPIGTEVITENFIDVIDFCHSRAMAGVQGAFEWSGDPTGMIKEIPMFDYVYHEFGPVRLDGYAKLSRRFGDIFYLIAARVYLYGAILELNYEFSSLELFPGMSGPSHYLTYDYWTQFIEDDKPERVHKPYIVFLRRMARARLGFGLHFLCWGRMQPPLTIVSHVPTLTLSYDHYNVFPELDSPRSGTVKASAIVSSGWATTSRLGFFFANISRKDLPIVCVFNPARYHLRGPYIVDYVSNTGRKRVGAFRGKSELKAIVPARNVIMLEVRPDIAKTSDAR